MIQKDFLTNFKAIACFQIFTYLMGLEWLEMAILCFQDVMYCFCFCVYLCFSVSLCYFICSMLYLMPLLNDSERTCTVVQSAFYLK